MTTLVLLFAVGGSVSLCVVAVGFACCVAAGRADMAQQREEQRRRQAFARMGR